MPSYGFQMYNINRSLARAGIDPEKFDTHAHLDRKLSMRENIANIRAMTGAGRTERHIRREVEKAGPLKKHRGTFDQTGSSNLEIDRRMRALAPGKRGHGKHAYYEYRKNRSDRPGSMV